jgi:Zn-dependent oligopeptidase
MHVDTDMMRATTGVFFALFSRFVADALDARYLYSLVFAADMYKTVFKADPLSAEMGHRYREMILRPGGSRDEMSSLEVNLPSPACGHC